MESVIVGVRESLAAVSAPRFFETERGFQGELLVQLRHRVSLLDDVIVEQEYQKRLMLHGLNIRPDIIVHKPYNPKFNKARTEGNIAVIELKLNASAAEAVGDFVSLSAMLDILQYPIGIFINIASARTHSDMVPIQAKGRIVCFAVYLEGNTPYVIEDRT
jgi:hypothetical protein